MHGAAPHAPAPHFGRSRATILLVEDNLQIRGLLESVLMQAQLEVLSAETAADALILAARHSGPIHLLVADLVLPDASGTDLAERFAKLHPQAGLLVMSGFGLDEIRSQGIDPQLVPILQKPFSITQFQERVMQLLQPILQRKK